MADSWYITLLVGSTKAWACFNEHNHHVQNFKQPAQKVSHSTDTVCVCVCVCF